ncbi:putative zinc finger CCHC domain-containing protein 3-like [Apostichopus japonicus]|uniref:Putative zinc finger CCHC domain-containing protein 3-like n=1 Tax=Stichopus japonicus TaxID=307972 RepID=A0A2G8JSR3_STIJA|nr:putative zinc finger CCHC domain-containing protein 3-like [Apostichopus japonicus]
MNVFDVRFTSKAACVGGVQVLEGVEGLKVTPYDSSVCVTVLHLPLDMSKQGCFGKMTGYEEPEFIECKDVKTETRRVRVELKSDIPSTLWANGHMAHIAYPGQPCTCWRCGLEGHEARLCPNKRCSRCLQVGHTLAECKRGHRMQLVWEKRAFSPVLCPDRSYAARLATGVVEAVPVPAYGTVSPDAPLIAPVSDTSAPVEAFNPFRVPPRPRTMLPLRPRLPICPLRRTKTAGPESTGTRDIEWPRLHYSLSSCG